jgi:hypothetical protein
MKYLRNYIKINVKNGQDLYKKNVKELCLEQMQSYTTSVDVKSQYTEMPISFIILP